jgi:hypothetical protein
MVPLVQLIPRGGYVAYHCSPRYCFAGKIHSQSITHDSQCGPRNHCSPRNFADKTHTQLMTHDSHYGPCNRPIIESGGNVPYSREDPAVRGDGAQRNALARVHLDHPRRRTRNKSKNLKAKFGTRNQII